MSRLRVWRQLGSFVNRQNAKGILASREITLKTTFSIEKVEDEEETVSAHLLSQSECTSRLSDEP